MILPTNLKKLFICSIALLSLGHLQAAEVVCPSVQVKLINTSSVSIGAGEMVLTLSKITQGAITGQRAIVSPTLKAGEQVSLAFETYSPNNSITYRLDLLAPGVVPTLTTTPLHTIYPNSDGCLPAQEVIYTLLQVPALQCHIQMIGTRNVSGPTRGSGVNRDTPKRTIAD